jgi:PAS domain S-box-containing protein
MGAGDGVLAVDDQQRIVFWNEAAREILGYEAGEILGQTCCRLFTACSLQGALPCRPGCRFLREALQGCQIPTFTIEARTRQGDYVLLDVSAVCLPGMNSHCHETILLLFCRQLAAQLCPAGKFCLYLLGPLSVWRPDGSLVSGPNWRRLEERHLLAQLAARRGEVISEQSLQSWLWPERPTAERQLCFQKALSGLRRTLEPGLPPDQSTLILRRKGGISLAGGRHCWLDLEAFEQQIHQARLEPDAVEAVKLYRQALRLYRGPFVMDLPGLAGTLRDERVRLKQLYLEALDETGLSFEKIGRIQEACWYYCLALTVDPDHIEARRLLYRLQQSAVTQDIEQSVTLSQTICNQAGGLFYGGKNFDETL